MVVNRESAKSSRERGSGCFAVRPLTVIDILSRAAGIPEIDLDKKVWTVPANRMKAAREHRVPLSPRAVTVLRKLEKLKSCEFVFPGQARNKPLSNMAMDGPDQGATMLTRRVRWNVF
jgi:integrase